MPNKRKCRTCKNYYPVDSGIVVPLGFYCSHECRAKYTNSSQAKAKAKKIIKRANKKAKKELDRSDISWQLKNTRIAFNKMRVLEEKLWFYERGMEPECISCGKTNMDWCCGHYKTVAAQGVIRFDRRNTFLQCNRYCNESLSGNISGNKNTRGYEQGLRDRFGEDKAKEIMDYCASMTNPAKWDCEQLEADRKNYNQRIRDLEKELSLYA